MADGAKRAREAVKGELTGGCLCGAVRSVLRDGFRLGPYACHCTDCQSRTGTAFSEHMLFSISDFEVTGELDTGQFAQPSGAKSQIFGCVVCKTRIHAVNDQRGGFGSLRCGTLNNSSELNLKLHVWVRSKQPWLALPDDAVVMDEQPKSTAEWIKFAGLAP